jgi:uncharacterized protein (TIGR02246 family)
MADNNRDEAAIRALVETWHRATGAGDVAGVLPLMAEDALFLAPERPPLRGRAAFADGLTDILKTHRMSSSGVIREIKVSGDLAYCWTNLTVTITPLDGTSPQVRKGPVLSIFRKQSDGSSDGSSHGSWVLVRDANMVASDSAELALKVDNLERELMADGPGG